MTNILGLHFGHNSHAVILKNGNIKSYVQRERISGNKNQAGINRELIDYNPHKIMEHYSVKVVVSCGHQVLL